MSAIEKAAGLAGRFRASYRPPSLDFDALLFPPQRAFANDPATFVTADCSRRAGKSEGVGARLFRTAVEEPRAPVLYFTTTRKEAKRIMWEKMLRLNREHGLGFHPVESELVFKREGVARVYLTGCDNQTEIGKMRGSGWGDVAGDEAQLFPAYIKSLVEDVITPSLMDFDGSLRLTGTPGPVPIGYFYEACHSPKWSHHRWTCWDNPYVKPRATLNKALELRGVSEDDPSIQREFYGRWVYDPNALVFRWEEKKNAYLELPTARAKWQHVIGIDLGFDDADAIGVLAFNEALPAVYLVEEWVAPKQTISELADRLREAIELYDPVACVMDTGGLGKKITEEIRRRHAIPIKAAEKTRKHEYIELLNDALRSGRFFAKADSRFAADALRLEWDKDRSRGDKRVVSDRFHSDLLDSVLYAYRESLHWTHAPPVPEGPAMGSAKWEDELEAAEVERAEREQKEHAEEDPWA